MATYKFTLTTPDGPVNFGADQIENWSDITPSYVVNDKYRGIFREFTSTFNFVKDIRGIIIRAFDKYGYDVDIFLSIYAGNDNAERLSYKQIAYRLRADIQKIDITELAVSLNFIDSGFVANIMNREDVEVNLELPDAGFIQSIDGDSVRAVDKLLWPTQMHDRKLIFNSAYQIPESISIVSDIFTEIGGGNYRRFYVLPLSIKYSSDDNFQNVFSAFTDVNGNSLGQSAFYLISEKSRVINFDINLQGNFLISSPFDFDAGNVGYRYGFCIRRAEDGIPDEFFYSLESSVYFGGSGANINNTLNEITPFPFAISYQGDIEIFEGDSMEIFFELRKDDVSTFAVSIGTQYDALTITATSLELYPVTTADLILPHELFTQLLQIYTGQETPFYSEFFGRPDLGYDSYGPGSGVAVATGKMIRGFPYGTGDDTQTYLNTSFEKAFEAYNKIFNLAATIEVIGNEQRLRIEPMSYFRNFEVITDLSDKLKDVSRKVDTKKLYSDIEIGYKDREYEELNGLFSFNGEMGLSTPLNTDAETLSLTNDWRADDIGIEITRRQQYKNDPSKDYRSDDDIFFVDCSIIEEGGSFAGNYFLLPKTDNEYDSVTGIFEPTRAYNLDLSPKRCFYNWQDEIKAGLTFKPDKSLKFIKGPKNAKLVSKKTGEMEIIEAADVEISTLKNPTFIPEIFMIAEAPLTIEEWEDIKLNRYGVYAFEHKGVKLYGYISSIEFEINKKTANFELLRANL